MVQSMLYAGHWSSGTDQDQESALGSGSTHEIELNSATAISVSAANSSAPVNAYVSNDATHNTGARTGGSTEGIGFIHVRIDTDDPPSALYFSHGSGFAANLAAVRHYSERE